MKLSIQLLCIAAMLAGPLLAVLPLLTEPAQAQLSDDTVGGDGSTDWNDTPAGGPSVSGSSMPNDASSMTNDGSDIPTTESFYGSGADSTSAGPGGAMNWDSTPSGSANSAGGGLGVGPSDSGAQSGAGATNSLGW